MIHEHIIDAVRAVTSRITRQDSPIVPEVPLADEEQGEADKKRPTVRGIARSVVLGGMSEEQAIKILEDPEKRE